MNNKPLIICASGNSIPFNDDIYKVVGCGLPDKLVEIIENNYSIGLNYWYKFGCDTTFNCSGDWQFYIDNKKELKDVPMIVSADDPQLKNKNISRIHSNTTLIPHSALYAGVRSWDKNPKGKVHGIYHRQLIGIFALTLGIALGFKEIYLLGYDCKEINGQTHFYQGLVDMKEHIKIFLNGVLKDKRYFWRGVGRFEKKDKVKDNRIGRYKTSTYNNECGHLNKKWFAPFHAERKTIKIYNVSPESQITIFPTITYEQFYKQIKNNEIDQIKARQEIKSFIQQKIS